MTYEILRYIFIGAAALSGIMLIVSVLLFILLRIPRVIGDLTGVTAKRAIESIRNQNESSGDKIYKSSKVNRERGKLTDKISASGSIAQHDTNPLGGAMATTKIATQGLKPNIPPSETTVLDGEPFNETTLLDNETALSSGAANETTVLCGQPDATTVLQTTGAIAIEFEITFIHTDEVIA